MPGGKTRNSVEVPVPSGLLVLAVPTTSPALISLAWIGRVFTTHASGATTKVLIAPSAACSVICEPLIAVTTPPMRAGCAAGAAAGAGVAAGAGAAAGGGGAAAS